tara:strand:+ start:190 stop:393 length:204 start_codon:yes stop_codon:yes gene_type:complete
MMTRKHYDEIVTILATHKVSEALLFDLARMFENDNPRFETGRFMAKYIEIQNALQTKNIITNYKINT